MKKHEDGEKKYVRPQTCRNCGINGHLYKDCIHPIMSFGIICYKKENNKINYLMIQRKDSLSFMEFIRGKYSIGDIGYIKQLVSSMTQSEKKLLLNKSFDDVWNYTWYQNNSVVIKHTSEYHDSKNKFDYLQNNEILSKIIQNIVCLVNQEQEWGFPKGRRKLKETDLNCAIREFCEETRLKAHDIDVRTDIKPFEEIFYGTNNILYKHTYYIAMVKNNDISVSVDKNCLEQIREVRALKWFDFEDVIQHINEHNIERFQIITKVNETLCLK